MPSKYRGANNTPSETFARKIVFVSAPTIGAVKRSIGQQAPDSRRNGSLFAVTHSALSGNRYLSGSACVNIQTIHRKLVQPCQGLVQSHSLLHNTGREPHLYPYAAQTP